MEDPHHGQAQQIAQEAVNAVLERINNPAGWNALESKDGVEGFNIAGDTPQIVKVTALIDRPASHIRDFMWDINNKKKWDETLKLTEVVKTFGPNLRIIHDETNAPWPVSNRDVVLAQTWVEREDGFLIAGRSINGVVPEVNGVVRAEVLFQGAYIQRVSDTRSRLTTCGCFDPRGSIPNMVVNKMSKKQVGKLLALRKAI